MLPPPIARPAAMLPAVTPIGINVQLRAEKFGTMALGPASTFELREVSPVSVGGAAIGRRQMSGVIQFPAGDQQALQANSCFKVSCVAALTITNATPNGTTIISLNGVSFTQVLSGPTVSLVFAYQAMEWGPAPGSSPPQVATPPIGISIGFRDAKSGPSTGMASTFQLQEVAPVTVGGALAGRRQMTGTIQYVAGDPQAMLANACLINNCAAGLTITDATPQGTTSYVLGGVTLTQMVIGPTVSVAFEYQTIQWRAPAAPSLSSPGATPMGISVGFRDRTAAPSTGMATTFQLQEVAPVTTGGALSGRRQMNGAIEYAAGDPQAMLANACFINNCAAGLTITNATPQGTTSYVLGNVTLTRMLIGPTVSVAFEYQTMQWEAVAPGSSQPQLPVPAPSSAPAGVSVTLRPPAALRGPGDSSGTIWLGMASIFQLSTGTQGTGNFETRPDARATGTVEFAAGDAQAMQVNTCFIDNCVAGLTITNVMPYAATVFTLRNVTFTRLLIGATVSVAFEYQKIEWQTTKPDVLLARPAAPLSVTPGVAAQPPTRP